MAVAEGEAVAAAAAGQPAVGSPALGRQSPRAPTSMAVAEPEPPCRISPRRRSWVRRWQPVAAARPKEEAERLMAPEIEIFASDFVQGVNSSNFCHTRSMLYKGWLIRDEIWRLVEFQKVLRDADYLLK